MEQAVEMYGKKPLTAAEIKAQVQLIHISNVLENTFTLIS